MNVAENYIIPLFCIICIIRRFYFFFLIKFLLVWSNLTYLKSLQFYDRHQAFSSVAIRFFPPRLVAWDSNWDFIIYILDQSQWLDAMRGNKTCDRSAMRGTLIFFSSFINSSGLRSIHPTRIVNPGILDSARSKWNRASGDSLLCSSR